MSFFQNVFAEEFRGNWVLGDRQQALTFICPANAGRGSDVVTAWNEGPYNLAIADADGNPRSILTFTFALSGDLFKNWATVGVNVAGAVPAATTPSEISTILNNNTTFNSYFVCSIEKFPSGTDRINIRAKTAPAKLKFFINNGGTEEAIRFNARAGVSELPSYFNRHTCANRFVFEDCQNILYFLQAGVLNVDDNIIDQAVNARGIPLNYNHTVVQPDWQLLKGRSGIFNFQLMTLDGSNRITQIIEFGAGSKAGDMARKIQYHYTGAVTSPDRIWETPYQLTSGDIAITPP